jgi:DNA polymerase V
MRVPLHLEDAIHALIRQDSEAPSKEHLHLLPLRREHSLRLPIAGSAVPAGRFDDPDASEVPESIDLNLWLARNPDRSYVCRVSGDSMNRAGIHDGDRLVVDRLIPPRSGHIVVAWISGEGITVKRLRLSAKQVTLEPDSDNPQHSVYTVADADELRLLGVVCGVARRLL